MKPIVTSGSLNVGDRFTVAGVRQADARSPLRKLWDWILRRQPPERPLVVFTLTNVTGPEKFSVEDFQPGDDA